jgi:hypothetical protein
MSGSRRSQREDGALKSMASRWTGITLVNKTRVDRARSHPAVTSPFRRTPKGFLVGIEYFLATFGRSVGPQSISTLTMPSPETSRTVLKNKSKFRGRPPSKAGRLIAIETPVITSDRLQNSLFPTHATLSRPDSCNGLDLLLSSNRNATRRCRDFAHGLQHSTPESTKSAPTFPDAS